MHIMGPAPPIRRAGTALTHRDEATIGTSIAAAYALCAKIMLSALLPLAGESLREKSAAP